MHPRARALLMLTFALAARPALADEADNWSRLRAMPREQRLHLARTLDRFDALPSAERAAVRRLDAAVAGLEPSVQDRYRALLRRYHVWVNGLDEAKRKQLDEAGTIDAKIALVTRWRKAERDADDKVRKNLIFGVHPGDLGTIPPFEMANALRVWSTLDAAEKARIEALDKVPRRIDELNKIGLKRHVPAPPRFSEAIEDGLLKRLEADDQVKTVFAKAIARQQEKAAPAAQRQADRRRMYNPLHQLSESLYFIEHPPRPVSLAHLVQFESLIPPWLRASLDPLPPDEARRRLTIVYRQLYPAGQEIPIPARAEPSEVKTKAVPKPSAPAGSPSPTPF